MSDHEIELGSISDTNKYC